MLPTRDSLQKKRNTQTESEGVEKYSKQMDTHKRKAGVVILISDKLDFKTTAVKRDPEGHFIVLKEKSIKKT